MLSTTSIYLLTDKEARRSLFIGQLSYMIRSSSSGELLLYFRDDSDLRLIIPNDDERDEFFDLINMRFSANCPNQHLRLYEVPEPSLKLYKTTKKNMGGFAYENTPDDQYRLRDLEIMT